VTLEDGPALLCKTFLGRIINVHVANYTYRNGVGGKPIPAFNRQLKPGLLCRVLATLPEDLYQTPGGVMVRWNVEPIALRESLRGCSEFWVLATASNVVTAADWSVVDDWFGGRSLRGNHAPT
jgi:hypothetical protein